MYIVRRVGGSDTWLWSGSITVPSNTWSHWRVTWWRAPGIGLIIRVEREVSGVWEIQGPDALTDTVNQWNTSSINRTGVRGYRNIDDQRVDDTEIWSP